MQKLNLHAHTNFSDGQHTPWGLANELKKLGHKTIVITDHDIYMTPDRFLQQMELAKEAEKELEVNIICGLECFTLYDQEIGLFGSQAVLSYLHYREDEEKKSSNKQIIFTPEFRNKHLANTNHAIILHHPFLVNRKDIGYITEDKEFWGMIDAVEETNADKHFDLSKIASVLNGKRRLAGMDIHDDTTMKCACNLVDYEIPLDSESDIIAFIKTRHDQLG